MEKVTKWSFSDFAAGAMELAEEKSAMDVEFQDILRDRRKKSDFLWASRNWIPACAYGQIKISNPDDIKNNALGSDLLKITIHKLSKLHNIPEQTLYKSAVDMLKEIGYDRDIFVLRFLAYITSKILKNLLLGVRLNEEKFLKIRSQFGRNPVLLVPNHRSYGDFILMSYICFHYDVDIPRIAAGMDFHSMKFMSTILRKSCAFFMRRSFTNDKLYASVFELYVHSLITDGDASVEFFIEGGRSRTAKSLVPKYGFLTMALKPFFTALVPDVTILPVSFSYDRVLEERLFAFELLGVPKPKESTKGLFKAYSSIFNENLGYIHVNFGDPISVKEFYGSRIDRSIHNFGPVELQQITSDESKQIRRLAHTIVRQQQRLTMITCFNLIATVFNHHMSERCETLSLDELVSEVEWLSAIMKGLGARLTRKGDLSESVPQSIQLHKSLVTVATDGKIKLLRNCYGNYECHKSKLTGHCLSSKTMDNVIPLLMIQYYSNPCAYFLVNLCFVSLIVQFQKNGTLSVDELFSQFQFLRSVFLHEFVFDKETEEEDFASAFEFSKNQKAVVQSESEVEAGENKKLSQFCVSFIRLYICSYLIVIDVLLQEPDSLVSNQNISKNYQKAVESLMVEDIRIHPAALSLNLVENALQAFARMDAAKKIRRKNQVYYEISYDQLKVIKSRLGNFDAVTKLNGDIFEHLANFLHCKL